MFYMSFAGVQGFFNTLVSRVEELMDEQTFVFIQSRPTLELSSTMNSIITK